MDWCRRVGYSAITYNHYFAFSCIQPHFVFDAPIVDSVDNVLRELVLQRFVADNVREYVIGVHLQVYLRWKYVVDVHDEQKEENRA